MTENVAKYSTETPSPLERLEYGDDLRDLQDEIYLILTKKHHDYGTKNLLKRGLFGILVRLDDKLARLDNLITNKIENKVEDETLEDTLMDIIGYCLQAILINRGKLK